MSCSSIVVGLAACGKAAFGEAAMQMERADFSGQNLILIAASSTISGCSSSSVRLHSRSGDIRSNCQRQGKTSSRQMSLPRMMPWLFQYAKTVTREFGR